MISLTKILVVAWIITGFIGLIWGTKALNNPADKGRLKEHMKDFAHEIHATEEDFLCVLYVAFFATGLLSGVLICYRKLRNYIKGRWNV